MKYTLIIAFVLFVPIKTSAQIDTTFHTVESVVEATYHLLSGPAGARDWITFKKLFHPTANMGANLIDKKGHRTFYPFSPEQYMLNNDTFLKNNDFYETEIGRKIRQFGGVAQVFSGFQYRFAKDGDIKARGINCFQLVKEKGRWWITTLVWENEHPNNLIAKEFFDKQYKE